MITLIKRLLFVLILAGIAYGIYWMINKKSAEDLKDKVIETVQKTDVFFDEIVGNNLSGDQNSGNFVINENEIEKFVEKEIIVTDTEIKEPEIKKIETTKKPATTKTTTTTQIKTTSNSEDILFELFQ